MCSLVKNKSRLIPIVFISKQSPHKDPTACSVTILFQNNSRLQETELIIFLSSTVLITVASITIQPLSHFCDVNFIFSLHFSKFSARLTNFSLATNLHYHTPTEHKGFLIIQNPGESFLCQTPIPEENSATLSKRTSEAQLG